MRDAFQTFGEEGVEAALAFFRPDFVWYTSDRWLEAAAYRGHNGLRKLVAGFSENFDTWGYDLHDVLDAHEAAVALTHMTGQIKNSTQSISQPLGVVVSDFRDGKIGEVRAFASWHEALKAVGLEE